VTRSDNRALNELRPVHFETGFTRWAEGSVLTRFGETCVLCNVTVEETLPQWLRNSSRPQGWLTAEYALLPRSTQRRTQRETRWPKGRTQEISRLIGRSLRMAVDLPLLGERQLIVDCDVLQADGGTRTAAVTGGWVAVALALQSRIAAGALPPAVLRRQIAAISAGMVGGEPLLDLAYQEDVAAESDVNIVMTAEGELIEIQGTAEKEPFSRADLYRLLELARNGIQELAELQRMAVQGAG
jgi:ribonuclease PH